MSTTRTAHSLGAHHAITPVLLGFDAVGIQRLPKAGPACARLELGLCFKQVCPAARTLVNTRIFGVGILTGKGRFGAFAPTHGKLGWGEFRFPLFFGLFDFSGHTDNLLSILLAWANALPNRF